MDSAQLMYLSIADTASGAKGLILVVPLKTDWKIRCVYKFDHHCKWVNNCIGEKNYKQFLVMITGVLIFAVTYTLFMTIATINFSRYRFETTENTYTRHHGVNTTLMCFIWIFSLPTLILMVLDFNLVALHLYLGKKKMTTFEYIMYIRDKKELQESMVSSKSRISSDLDINE